MPSLKLIKFDLMYFKKKLKSILNRYKALFNLQCYIRRRQFYGQVKAREKVLKLNNSVWGAVEIKKKVNQLRIYEEGEKTYKIKAIWLGADPNQDQVGFLQELKSIVDLKIFKNIENQPCLYYKQDDPDAAVKNSISLFKLLEEVSCELVIGQFWPELIDLNYVPLHQILKNKNIRVICIAMDDFMPERWLPRRNGIISGPAGHGESVSLYATSDLASVQRYYKLGLNACYLPFGCTLNLRQNARERDIDVLFVGSNYGRRGEVIAFLRKNGIQVTSYGPGFELGRVNADEIVSLYSRAKIVLGICNVGFQIKEVNLKTRDFDAISCGALVVSNACHEFNVNMTPGLHYIQYFEFPDLLQKIQYFLKHPSEARIIAEFGFNHGLKNHLWREHLKKVIYDIS